MVADKLKVGLPVDPEEFSDVTIYFSDIVGKLDAPRAGEVRRVLNLNS